MKNKLARSLVAASVLVASGAVSAAGEWTVNLGAGYQGFDGERDLDEAVSGILGLEYRLSDSWSVELRAEATSADNNYDVKPLDADIVQGHLDLLYNFGTGKVQPYIVGGLGHADFDSDVANSGETQANLGAGVRWVFADNWSTRFDVRAINSLDNELWDGMASLVIGYSFGGNDQAKEAPAPAPTKKAKEMDSDGDGVGDSTDSCAQTPAGVTVNASGCPLDTDADGVADYLDKCPQTPAGRQVDEQGCKFVLTRSEQIRMEVNFASNSSTVPETYMAEIEKVASFLKKFGGVSAVIEGHSDSSGSDAYNKTLSQRRADAVKAELVTRFGIDASRLTSIGYGEERPIASNDTREGRNKNRRVVAVVKAEVSE